MPKKRKLDNHTGNYMQEKSETFGQREYEDELFDLLDGQQVEVTTDEIDIMTIWADPTQPRRIIPSEIRDEWDGNPIRMPDLLQAWAEMLYDSGNDLPIDKILKGQDEPYQYKTGEVFVDKFIDLLVLASQIRGVGLNHRIGVRPQGDKYIIIHGERRWTAFQMLNHFLPMEAHEYASIPAKVAHVDAWTVAKMQAQENVREEPNAIGKTRMYAKLLMAAYADNPEYKFDPPHAVNSPTCDRPWYAQAKKLNIPRGMGAEFETALGISTGQMRQYNKLLALTEDYEIDNAIWNLADDNDWAERFQREMEQYLELDDFREILDTVTVVTVSQIEDAFREAIESGKNAASLAKKQKQRDEKPYLNRWVELHTGWIGRVTEQDGNKLFLEDIDGFKSEANVHLIIDKDVTPRSNRPAEDDLPEPESVGTGFSPSTDEPGHLPRFKPTETVFYDGTIPARIRGYNDDGTVTIHIWNGDQKTVDEDDLLPLAENEYLTIVKKLRQTQNAAGADNSSSPPVDEQSEIPFGEFRAREWVGKPALYHGEPCFVIKTKKGMPGHVVIQIGKHQDTVHYANLQPAADKPEQTLGDFMEGDSENDHDDEPPISSLSSLPLKSPYLISGTDRGFINTLAIAIAGEGLEFNKLRALYQFRESEIDPALLPYLLEGAMQQVEAYTARLHKKATNLFKDVAQKYAEDTDG